MKNAFNAKLVLISSTIKYDLELYFLTLVIITISCVVNVQV